MTLMKIDFENELICLFEQMQAARVQRVVVGRIKFYHFNAVYIYEMYMLFYQMCVHKIANFIHYGNLYESV